MQQTLQICADLAFHYVEPIIAHHVTDLTNLGEVGVCLPALTPSTAPPTLTRSNISNKGPTSSYINHKPENK